MQLEAGGKNEKNVDNPAATLQAIQTSKRERRLFSFIQFMVVGQAGGFRHLAVLRVVMECKYFHGLAQIPRQNMVEDLAKEPPKRKKSAQKNLVQVSI